MKKKHSRLEFLSFFFGRWREMPIFATNMNQLNIGINIIMRTFLSALTLFLSVGAMAQTVPSSSYTRGIGQYPGRPSEFYGPRFERVNAAEAPLVNLALHLISC